VVGARALARRMPHETPPPADDNGSG
jgi:hypothetical protein